MRDTELRPIAVKPLSNFGGIEILSIAEGIDTKIKVRENYGDGKVSEIYCGVVEIDGATTRPYFMYKGEKEFLDEYMLTDYPNL